MGYRRRMSSKSSKKYFSRGANRIHKKNVMAVPLYRGGIRL